jgi:predicted transcriptional regulator of viral defense system
VSEPWQFSAEGWRKSAKVGVSKAAKRQFGRVSRSQLVDLGVTDGRLTRWLAEGYLYRTLPGVYAVGHQAPSVEGEFADALLYGGHGSMLSHATALWWMELIRRKPLVIHVSTPGRHRSRGGLKVHGRRDIDRVLHNRLPVTPLPQALLDYAVSAPLKDVSFALLQAEYEELLDIDAVTQVLRRGRPGSARLREALERHDPRLARTRSRLERRFLALCKGAGIPLPDVNAELGRQTVDAVWWKEKVVVELDGGRGHSSRAQMVRDRRRDLHLRALGFTVIRYTEYQLYNEPELVIADLKLALGIAD